MRFQTRPLSSIMAHSFHFLLSSPPKGIQAPQPAVPQPAAAFGHHWVSSHTHIRQTVCWDGLRHLGWRRISSRRSHTSPLLLLLSHSFVPSTFSFTLDLACLDPLFIHAVSSCSHLSLWFSVRSEISKRFKLSFNVKWSKISPFYVQFVFYLFLRTQKENVCTVFILLSIDSDSKEMFMCCPQLSLFFFLSRVLRFLNSAIRLIIYTCIHHLYYSQLWTQLTCLD